MKKFSHIAIIAFATTNCAFAQKAKADSVTKTRNIDEVVLVGYGTNKKSTHAGSSTNLDQKALKALKDQPAVNLVSSIQGALPGVTIISRPGDVGSNPAAMNIRGRGTTDGSGGPMYIIDGIVSTSGDFYRINPRDIENLSVLKDGSAAIYGTRAAYGVVLVTTKKGAAGKMVVNYDVNYSLQSPTYLPDYVGSVDYMTLRNEAAANAGISIPFTAEQIEMARSGKYPDLYPNNNWFDLVLQKMAALNEHSINISGGNGGTKYYVSAGYIDQESLIPTKDMKRYSFRTNLDSKVSDKFKIGTNISFIKEDLANDGGDFSFVSLQRMVPTMVAIHSDGTYGTINAGRLDATLGKDNPLRRLRESGNSGREIYKATGALTGTYTPVNGLSIDGLFSYKNNYQRNHGFNATVPALTNFLTKAIISGSAINEPNGYYETWYNDTNLLSQVIANYDTNFGKHALKMMAGSSFEKSNGRYLGAERKNYLHNFLNSIDAGSDADGNRFSSGGYYGNNRSILSYFGRLNYTYNDKYILETIFRADNSSQFAKGYRWGYFPSVMAAWVISREDFMQDNIFNNLKLRMSYGKTGNIGESVGNFSFYEILHKGSGAILDQSIQDAYFPGQYINQAFSWENVVTTNFGLDAALLDRRLSFTIDLYDRKTNGILSKPALANELGANSADWPILNLKDVDNKGIEFSANYADHIGNDFSYNVGFNFSRNWNEILDLGGPAALAPEDVWIQRVGGSIGDFYGYQASGLLTDDDIKNNYPRLSGAKAGDIKYLDLNGDKVINGDDRTVLGSDVPKLTYGVNISLNYKNFDFNLSGQGVDGTKVNLSAESAYAFFNGAGVKQYVFDNRWTKENPNPNALYPRVLMSGNNSQNQHFSSYWLFDSDYFRFRNISLGYTVPDYTLNVLNISKVRIFTSLQNYFIIRSDKRMKDFDPEFPTGRAFYPNLKTMTFGLNLTF